MQVSLKNSNTGMLKRTKLGFSWTGLFFGVFVPMVRGDWKGFFIWLIVDIVTVGLGWLIFPFVYNKSYIKRLINDKGFLPLSESDKNAMNSKGILVTKVFGE